MVNRLHPDTKVAEDELLDVVVETCVIKEETDNPRFQCRTYSEIVYSLDNFFNQADFLKLIFLSTAPLGERNNCFPDASGML